MSCTHTENLTTRYPVYDLDQSLFVAFIVDTLYFARGDRRSEASNQQEKTDKLTQYKT